MKDAKPMAGSLARYLFGAVLLIAAEAAALVAMNAPFVDSAQAQFFRDDGYRARPQRSGGGFFDGLFGPSPRREAPPEEREYRTYQGGGSGSGGSGGGSGDNSVAPRPRKADKDAPAPTTTVVVMGDGMADWLAYGLEDAFSDTPEIAIIRKNKNRSGLLRYDAKSDLDWWHVARDLLAPEKPSYVVMMLGVSDRDNIRERDIAKEAAKKEAEKKEAEKKEAERKKAAEQQDTKAAPDKGAGDKPVDAGQTAPAKQAATPAAEPEDADQPGIISPEQAGRKANGIVEFRTERWADIYSRRIDETLAALKSKGVPVFWVGLPAIKGSRSTADAVYLNDLYRSRAEKAGAIYIDVWDGFIDEGGKFTSNGPDYEGQVRRLRSADGVYFTKYGARKLAHYVERELRRYMSNRSLVSLPTAPAGTVPGDAKSTERPLAGPVVPLTVVPGNSDELLGGASANARGDAIATQVLVKGESLAPAPGRADNFAWRDGDAAAAAPVATATKVAPAPAVGAASAPPPSVAPPSAPQASAYTEPPVEPKKLDPKSAAAAKAAQTKAAESKGGQTRSAQSKAAQARARREREDNTRRARPPQSQRRPQSAQSGPFGGWFR